MAYSYPILNRVLNYYKSSNVDFSNKKIYACMHLLEPQLKMFELFIEFGFMPNNINVIGKAYSTNREVLEEIKNLGINADQPSFADISFDEQHSQNCQKIASKINDKDFNIVLDDGGELINSVIAKSIQFGVEQTSSGFRKLEESKLNFPVFNVARSKTKLTQESPLVARQSWERVDEYLQTIKLTNPKVLIIGLGPIGSSMKQLLKSEGVDVCGVDIETTKEALLKYLADEQPDIVLGATGTSVINKEDLQKLESDHMYHFISLSSSDREFPVVEFRKNNEVHEDVYYTNFVFVNNGFPISFKSNRNELTPIEIEKTVAMLMGSIFCGIVEGKGDMSGLINIPQNLELLVNEV